jgi:hypothetical protein
MKNTGNSLKYGKSKYLLLLLPTLIGIIFLVDYIRISGYETIPVRPEKNLDLRINELYYQLANGEEAVDWSQLDGGLEYIRNEYDCSDFRLVSLIRILYEAGERIPESYQKKTREVLFDFRYWWDDPGENSMCYWSENHQILFASAEYLIGQKFPDSIYSNSGLTGKQHMEKAKKRALDWLEMRWNYGFTEFYSGTYYVEDIAALVNLIDFAKDEELVIKSKIILDLLFYDMASQSIDAMFVSASGRAYEGNRKGGLNSSLGKLTNYYWGDGPAPGPGMIYSLVASKKYTLPEVFTEIAKDSSEVIIKQSNGLDISELNSEGFGETDSRSMMMQWGMEAFSNPEVIRNSLHHIRKYRMFSNDFLTDFKTMDFSLLNWLKLEPFLSRWLNPQSNGVAIQKGNTYTYKTKGYTMYTAQAYHPGTYGDQQHVFGMNINNHFSIFHTHPALEKDIPNQSPNYWVGYGHIPHTVQDRNVNLSLYAIPEKKGIMEMDLLGYTHAYFPMNEFDSAFVAGKYIFGKKGETYCVMIGAENLEVRDGTVDNIIQKGKKSYWITEGGSGKSDGTFVDFIERIKANPIVFDIAAHALTYQSNGKSYQLTYGEDFLVDGKKMDTDYARYDSPYLQANRKDKKLTIRCNGKTLLLDFDNLIREVRN